MSSSIKREARRHENDNTPHRVHATHDAHDMRAALLHQWHQDPAGAGPGEEAARGNTIADIGAAFVPLALPSKREDDLIRIVVRRGATSLEVHWPRSTAGLAARAAVVIRVDMVWLAVQPQGAARGREGQAAAAVREHLFRLVFFDNIYPYGVEGPAPLRVPMTEDHPQQPRSRKGVVRKAIDDALLQAAHDDGLDLVIGRCADFYGPGVTNAMLYAAAMQRQLAGKAAQWIGSSDRLHSYIYTIDAARGLVRLALDADAHGAWHLPTAQPAPTTRSLLEHSARLLGAPSGVLEMPRPVLGALSWFVPLLREVREMLYQNDHDYVFSSAKFEQRYPDFEITPYARGIEAMVESLRASPSTEHTNPTGRVSPATSAAPTRH